jgi:hypothetical protein
MAAKRSETHSITMGWGEAGLCDMPVEEEDSPLLRCAYELTDESCDDPLGHGALYESGLYAGKLYG